MAQCDHVHRAIRQSDRIRHRAFLLLQRRLSLILVLLFEVSRSSPAIVISRVSTQEPPTCGRCAILITHDLSRIVTVGSQRKLLFARRAGVTWQWGRSALCVHIVALVTNCFNRSRQSRVIWTLLGELDDVRTGSGSRRTELVLCMVTPPHRIDSFNSNSTNTFAAEG